MRTKKILMIFFKILCQNWCSRIAIICISIRTHRCPSRLLAQWQLCLPAGHVDDDLLVKTKFYLCIFRNCHVWLRLNKCWRVVILVQNLTGLHNVWESFNFIELIDFSSKRDYWSYFLFSYKFESLTPEPVLKRGQCLIEVETQSQPPWWKKILGES